MSTPDSAAGATGQTSSQEIQPEQSPGATDSVLLPNFLPPDRIVAQLSKVRTTQPIAALASANQYQRELTEVFLQAVQRGVENPLADFQKEGMLFNYATYFLAKWRERRAYPLFLRWFSLRGEEALELGGDTIGHHGSRLLASVWNGEVESLRNLALNREANSVCRGQALFAIGVLVAWGEWPRVEAESTFLFLAREGLEREKNPIWNYLAMICVQTELLPVFAELRRAQQEGWLDSSVISSEELELVEKSPRGALLQEFTRANPPITDVILETRWWAGFLQGAQDSSASVAPRIAPPRVGRNDLCPCGSGKKYKKCCGA